MRLQIFILLLFASIFSFAQQSLTTEQINRLADAGKVYGYIKYFHPWLQYKDVNWDSAFAANVEGIINAKNKEEYAAVMQRLLSSLADELTTVVNGTEKDSAYQVQPLAYTIKDSILYVIMNDAQDGSYGKMREALQNISKVKGVIFDMRRPANSKYNNTITGGSILDGNTSYYKGDVLMPSFRSVGYMGLPEEMIFKNYEVYFKETKPYSVRGYANRQVPLVFIVANEGQIPILATILQQKGKAAIILEEGRELLPGASISFYISDSVLVKMRTANAVNQHGSLLLVHPNATYLSNENSAAAISKAEDLMSNGFTNYTTVVQEEPLAIIHIADFTNEGDFPSLGYRMLAAAKIFSAIDHFFPNKKIMDHNWELSYRKSISKFIEAQDALQYMRAVAELYANIDDSHGFITTSGYHYPLGLNPIIQGRGNFVPPVLTRVVENKVVVFDIYNEAICSSAGIQKGDVILSINGEDPMKQIEDVRKYQPASNKASQTFFICANILFGKEGQVMKLNVKDANGKVKDISLPKLGELKGGMDNYAFKMYSCHNKPTFKLITKEIGYADLTSPMQQRDLDSMFTLLKNTKAIIFDMRGYPHCNGEFVSKLAGKRNIVISKGITPAPTSPNVKNFTDFESFLDIEDTHTAYQNVNYNNEGWVYRGKTVMLINELAQSAAETYGLMLKAISNTTFIGSHTAGADGALTNFNIPGNITLWFSGSNGSYPDGKPLQRVGIQPDIYVLPTIKGIQAGKDEVLDRAVRFVETGK